MEFIEVLNISGGDLNLAGLQLGDGGNPPVAFNQSFILADGAYAVFVANTDAAVNGGIPALGGSTAAADGRQRGRYRIWILRSWTRMPCTRASRATALL